MIAPKLTADRTSTKNLSFIDLYGFLENDGWTQKYWETDRKRKEEQPEPVDVALQKPKIIWVKQSCSTICKSYLYALANLDKVKEAKLEHFRSADYYKDMVSTRKDHRKKLALNLGAASSLLRSW